MSTLEHELIPIFIETDNFCKEFLPELEKLLIEAGHSGKPRGPKACLLESEIMSILLLYQRAGFKTFKAFYRILRSWLSIYFPGMPSYQRFIELQSRILIPLLVYSKYVSGEQTGVYYIDASKISVCNNKRAKRHKTFVKVAKFGKTTMGWFYGLKIHLVTNNLKQIMGFCITSGNTHDTKPVPSLTNILTGKLIGDRGYISSKLRKTLASKGLEIITAPRKNMKNFFINATNKALLKSRYMIETTIGKIKSFLPATFSCHRSPINAYISIICAMINYNFSLNLPTQPLLHQHSMLP